MEYLLLSLAILCILKYLNHLRVLNVTYETQSKVLALLNDLRFKIITGKIEKGDIRVVELEKLLVSGLYNLPKVSLLTIVYLYFKLRNKQQIISEIEKSEKQIESSKEIQDIYKKFLAISKNYFKSKSIFTAVLVLIPVVCIKLVLNFFRKQNKSDYLKNAKERLKYAMIMSEKKPLSAPYNDRIQLSLS